MADSKQRGSAGQHRSQVFYRIRLTILLSLLLAVLLYGYRDIQQRQSRNQWQRSLQIAVILLTRGQVDPEAVSRVRERVPLLEGQLNAEFHRYQRRSDGFRIRFYGPAAVSRPPPKPPRDTWLALFTYTYQQWRYTRSVDNALGVDSGSHDSRIYLVAHPSFQDAPMQEGERRRAQPHLVEGSSQQGGRIGVVEVELNPAMADLALAVAAHELFHTLGATDKYDAEGQSLIPSGLAEPERQPQFPQRYVEIMSRNRPIAPGREVPLDQLEELRVGPETAREVGW